MGDGGLVRVLARQARLSSCSSCCLASNARPGSHAARWKRAAVASSVASRCNARVGAIRARRPRAITSWRMKRSRSPSGKGNPCSHANAASESLLRGEIGRLGLGFRPVGAGG